MKKAGILGGMGPVSTIYFYNQIIKTFQERFGAIYHNDYPYMVIVNVPIPDNVDKLHQKNIMREELIKAAQLLEKAGVDFIVMPCNTEHIFFEDIIKNISIPMINIIDETLKKVKEENCQESLLLSTNSTIKYKLYEKNTKIISPNKNDQLTVNKIIYNLLSGKILKEDSNRIIEIIRRYNVNCVIVGCTELSLLFDFIYMKNKKIFDSTKILVEKTINEITKDY